MDKQISATETSVLQKDKAVVLLDVREDTELAICKIEGALHIPLGEIPDRWHTLPRDRTIVVFCHYGMRSAKAQSFLQSRGFDNVVNMQGGIDAWSTNVEPKIPRY